MVAAGDDRAGELGFPQHTTENRVQPGANSAVHRFCGDACHLDRRPQGFHHWIIGTHCRIIQRFAAFSQGCKRLLGGQRELALPARSVDGAGRIGSTALSAKLDPEDLRPDAQAMA
ncbi:MAG: hypothetical protein JO283_05610 [Bradyrhizobium sp.]|nr:hypothetical protein [Bradyrhizobium sp.]